MKSMLVPAGALLAFATLAVARPAAAVTPVCVQVEVKQWQRAHAPAQAAPAAPQNAQPVPAPSVPKDVKGATAPRSSSGAKEPAGAEKSSGAAGSTIIAFGPSDEPTPPAAPDIAASGDLSVLAEEPEMPAPQSKPAPLVPRVLAPAKPEIDPALYLKRMLEYEVTHEPGYAAVQKGCREHLVVELYALEDGWTVFARYSENEREEKVDRVALEEFVPLAQRVARALLYDISISDTITRENVLDADSTSTLKRVKGRGHFVLGMGTMVRAGYLDTAQDDPTAPVEEELRVLTPLALQIGARYKLRSWGLDAFGRVNIGTSSTGVHDNDLGGHIDYGWGLGAGLRFIRYDDAPGISSLYYGGGADFELAIFNGIRAKDSCCDERESLVGGGLNLTALVGYEFLRSSSVHFFVQGELQVPTYWFNVEEQDSEIHTWMPGAVALVGMAF